VLPAPIAFTVNTAGAVCVAGRGDAATVPAVQVRLTCTEAALEGENTLFTVNVPLPGLSVLVMVQLPAPLCARTTAAQGAWLAVYPAGTVSVAVQVVPPKGTLLTAKTAGRASVAGKVPATVAPPVQLTLIVTAAPELGTKSLLTVSVAPVGLAALMIVQLPLPPCAMATFAHAA
jgi:hypothetical protein